MSPLGLYWNSSKRNKCPVLDNSQGITLRSLGGIFLATLCGLMLSMITLAYEVWQQKKQEKNKVHELDPSGGVVKGAGGRITKSSHHGPSKLITVGSKQVAFNSDLPPGY